MASGPGIRAWRSYYGEVVGKARSGFMVHFRTQIAVSLATGALSGAIGLLRGDGASGLVLLVAGFVVYLALAAGFYLVRAPVGVHVAQLAAQADTEQSIRELEGERALLDSIDLEVVSVGAAPLPRPEDDTFIVPLVVRNNGDGASFTASVVDQSIKGLEDAYPMGSFRLRWQMPTMSDEQWIGRGSDGRLEVATILPRERRMRFFGPGGTEWAVQRIVGDTIEGLIDIAIAGRDARQRLRFTMSTGTKDPVDIVVELVAHDP